MLKHHIVICILLVCIASIIGHSLIETRRTASIIDQSLIETRHASNSDCTCVPFYQCHRNYTIKTRGEGLIDRKELPQRRCAGSTLCCKKPNQPTETVEHSYCGNRNRSYSAQIDPKGLGDSQITAEAAFGEFPWMVAIFVTTTKLDLFTCGASIIQENVVMTAAHCVHELRVDDMKIRAGEWDLSVDTEIPCPQEKSISKLIIHPGFNKDTLENDIALLVLTSPLRFTISVAPVCLPMEGVLVESANCIATGWGKNKFGNDGRYQIILKRVVLPIVEHDECQRRLRTTRLGSYFELYKSFICAGGNQLSLDTCQGDGGGPLVCKLIGTNPPVYIQVGITSWGIGCGGDKPGVYINVFEELSWINTQLEDISTSKGQ